MAHTFLMCSTIGLLGGRGGMRGGDFFLNSVGVEGIFYAAMLIEFIPCDFTNIFPAF